MHHPYFPPPPPPPCPECERLRKSEYEKYGFNIVIGGKYWTKIPEVRKCCPIKVTVVESTAKEITVDFNGVKFTKDRVEFLKSSWRDYDSF